MTRRSITTVLIMTLLIPVNELHKLWDDVSYNVSPFLAIDYSLDVQWFVKFLGDKINWCIAGAVFYRLSRWNKEMQIAAIVFFAYAVMDLLLFFVCFNQKYHLLAYSLFCLVVVGVMCVKLKCLKEQKQSKGQGVQGSDTTMFNSSTSAKYKKELDYF